MTTRLHRDRPVPLSAALSGRTRGHRWTRLGLLAGLGLGALGLSALFNQSDSKLGQTLAASGVIPARAAVPEFQADCRAAPAPLQRQIDAIARSFDGKVGIAVVKAGCNWEVGARAHELFPQQSVSKLWVSLAVLDAVERGQLDLNRNVLIQPSDLTLFNQPLRGEVLENGSAMRTVHGLMSSALAHSDNTANDRLLWTVGGPQVVRKVLRDKGIAEIRFGPGERLLQSEVAGLTWSQDMALGRNFEQARARLPKDLRKAALDRYVANPLDGASPAAIARTMARLASGQLLSADATTVMVDILARTKSGPMRLKAGVPAGWKVYHKTGTGQDLRPVTTGYNDVGFLQAPDGSFYGVAVMIAETTQGYKPRMEMMQSVSRAVAAFHDVPHAD
ncbi:serine hydrolase [Novosphingobium sp.]|uniref:serine hydrolase n=1 Tax=Novosphingobium sp. TaxID=1874826 RepID=UPI0027375197|nr:serine hydrolase [Novosphingobium sp.]MDP3908293.1 serine hydrolase [Novosphingobium sp.]